MVKYHKQAVEPSLHGLLPSQYWGAPALVWGSCVLHFENANHTMAPATAKKKALTMRWKPGWGGAGGKWMNINATHTCSRTTVVL